MRAHSKWLNKRVKDGKNKTQPTGTHSYFLEETGVESRFLDCVSFLYRDNVLYR